MATILVIGGAGYIGSHMVKLLARAGHGIVVLDDLSSGHRDAVLAGHFVFGSTANRALLRQLFASHRFDAVMHFASFIQVGESVRDPGRYYHNNLANTLNVLNAMTRAGVPRFIFSSTAAIFGDPIATPIDEQHPRRPINPYGRSKWMVEELLRDFDHAFGLRSIALRYFNAAGADPDGELGERHDPETHLIPLVLKTARGDVPAVEVYGADYPTPDGTCVRDYVHVNDLCDAHLRALDCLLDGGESDAFNLGNGQGFSVRQVIDAARAVTGCRIRYRETARRPGDPPRLIADSAKIARTLGWQPRHGRLETIIEHAWRWELSARRTRARRMQLRRDRSAG